MHGLRLVDGDLVCEHGTALDVHCCNCHSGFLFDADACVCLPPVERRFECFINFLGWWHWSAGLHVDVRHPHFDLHLPFGYFRLGWHRSPTMDHPRTFGYSGWFGWNWKR